VRPLVLQPQRLPYAGTDREKLDHAAIGRLGVSPHNQASHQLALREIVPAAGGAVFGQVAGTQLHGKGGDTFNNRSRRRFGIHGILDVSNIRPFKKDFYKANPSHKYLSKMTAPAKCKKPWKFSTWCS